MQLTHNVIYSDSAQSDVHSAVKTLISEFVFLTKKWYIFDKNYLY